MKQTKNTMKDLMGVSIGGMAGLGAMGTLSKVPGMPPQATGVIPMAAVGVNLAQTGSLLNIVKNIVPDDKSKNKCSKKYNR